MAARSFDIAVVGFGPVGATLANLLGVRGHEVVVCDRDQEIYPLPRACHLDDTSLRVLQSAGLAKAVLDQSVPSLGMDMLDRRGRSFLTFAADHDSNLFGYPTSVLFWQPSFEETLREAASQHSTVDVRLGSEVVGLGQTEAGWKLETVGLAGEREEYNARFVIGCDGARSFTRSHIGADLVDFEFDQSWLVVDVALTGDAELPDRIVQYCDPTRPATFVPLPGSYRRWELMALPGEDLSEMERPETVRGLLKPWLAADRYELIRHSVYRFHGLVADRWSRGGVFLAGDAAHQMPPFLGQGMCSGIRDAANLSWKLDFVIRERAGLPLLASYEEERAPHVARLCERTIEIGNMIQVTEEQASQEETLPRRVVRGDSGAAPLTAGLIEDGSPGAGELFPQPALDGTLLDEALGRGFSIVTSGGLSGQSTELPVIREDSLRPWFANRHADFAIVRPDRYVFATGRQADLDAALNRLEARLAGG